MGNMSAEGSVIVKEALGKEGTNRKGVVNQTGNLVSLKMHSASS